MLEVESRIYVTKGRHYVYLPSKFVTDSAFPLDLKTPVKIRIEGRRVVIEQ